MDVVRAKLLTFALTLPEAVEDYPWNETVAVRTRKAGWVTVPVDAEEGVELDLLCDWIEESYRIVAPKRLVAALDSGASTSQLAK